MSTDLRSYLEILESEKLLTHIKVGVNPLLEIAAITDRVCKQPDGGNALIFENPLNSNLPVATNLFGSKRRCAIALGVDDPQQLTAKISHILDQIPDFSFNSLDLKITGLPFFSNFAPTNSKPLWRLDKKPIDLFAFPFLQNWFGDGSASCNGRYITMGQVFTSMPDGTLPNCGLYRAQVISSDMLAIAWYEGSGAAQHLSHYGVIEKPMPVAIALGGDPALLFSAMMPLPGNLDEAIFAGFLRRAPLSFAPALNVPLKIPASAEIVIEGFVDSNSAYMEGPFGNHTGAYSPAGNASVMKVVSVSMRDNPMLPATVVGPPPMEDCWMQDVWGFILLAFIKKNIPEIKGLHIPHSFSFQQSAVISLEGTPAAMVREIASQLWGLPWFKRSRLLVFVSAHINVHDFEQVVWSCINKVDSRHDIIMEDGHVAIDATKYDVCSSLQRGQYMESIIKRRWHEYGFN